MLSFPAATVYSQDEQDNKIHTVVIDAGHGGKDSGALGKFSKEKDIVLSLSLKVGKYIEENYDNVEVIYTRTTDEFIPLHKRAEIANENNADVFISIHANANTNPKPYGTSSHVLGLHRADENFEVAKRENSVILLEDDYSTRYENFDPNSPESYIIFSLMQNVYFDQSINLAQLVQDQFRERAKRKDRGVVQQGLLVLAQTSMPGILIETGFITNPDEEIFLNSEEGQDYLASSIFRAFRDYKNYIESKSAPVLAYNYETPEPGTDYKIMEFPSDSVLFKVQIAASSKSIPLDDELFTEFSDIQEIKAGGMFKYAVGTKTSYEEILEYSKTLRNRFPDAFIIALRNGELVSLETVLK